MLSVREKETEVKLRTLQVQEILCELFVYHIKTHHVSIDKLVKYIFFILNEIRINPMLVDVMNILPDKIRSFVINLDFDDI